MFSIAQSYWNHRTTLAGLRRHVRGFNEACNNPSNLALFQFGQLAATTFEFRPDVVLELGRGAGNSTCIFTEVAGRIGARVISLDLWNNWEEHTVPRLSVPQGWFTPLLALRQDIVTADFAALLGDAVRVLVFWDAHGLDVAEAILARLLPELAVRPHLVLMHDMFDARYGAEGNRLYRGGLWKRDAQGRVRLGWLDSEMGQAIAIYDFACRNELPLRSADHDLHEAFSGDPLRRIELEQSLGELFSLSAWWIYFDLAEATLPLTFPRPSGTLE